METFKTQMLDHFKKAVFLNEIEKSQKIDSSTLKVMHAEFKKFVKDFVKTIKDYQMDYYGDSKELE